MTDDDDDDMMMMMMMMMMAGDSPVIREDRIEIMIIFVKGSISYHHQYKNVLYYDGIVVLDDDQ